MVYNALLLVWAAFFYLVYTFGAWALVFTGTLCFITGGSLARHALEENRLKGL